MSTPGNVHAWEALSRGYGALAWRDLFTDAIALAEKGFVLEAGAAASIEAAFGDFPVHARKIYGRADSPLRSGERLVQKDLARSLRLVAAEGARAFYEGPIARAIDSSVRQSGGFLGLEDLRADQAEWRAPIRVKYRGHEVYTASPPSTAFPSPIRLGLAGVWPLLTARAVTDRRIRVGWRERLGFWKPLSEARRGRGEINIYAISLRPARAQDRQRQAFSQAEYLLNALTRETGGRAYFPSSVGELDSVYERIAEELRTLYSVGYVSANLRRDGKWRRIVVRVPDREGLQIRHKLGYYAPPG